MRFMLSIYSLFFHMLCSCGLAFLIVRSYNKKCDVSEFAIMSYCLMNFIALCHDWHGALSIHPKDYRNYNLDIEPLDEENIRTNRDNTFNIIIFGFHIITLGIACYSHSTKDCFFDIDILMMAETSIYIVVSTIVYFMFRNRKPGVNTETRPII